jgi:hypothetical protein
VSHYIIWSTFFYFSYIIYKKYLSFLCHIRILDRLISTARMRGCQLGDCSSIACHVGQPKMPRSTWPNGGRSSRYRSQWWAAFGYPHPGARVLNSSLRFCSALKRNATLDPLVLLPVDVGVGTPPGSSNGDGVVERAEELQRRGRAEPSGAVVPVQPAAVLHQRHHLRPRHHVRRVDARPAPPGSPRRLLPRVSGHSTTDHQGQELGGVGKSD